MNVYLPFLLTKRVTQLIVLLFPVYSDLISNLDTVSLGWRTINECAVSFIYLPRLWLEHVQCASANSRIRVHGACVYIRTTMTAGLNNTNPAGPLPRPRYVYIHIHIHIYLCISLSNSRSLYDTVPLSCSLLTSLSFCSLSLSLLFCIYIHI